MIAAHLGLIVQKTAEGINILFVVNTFGDPGNIASDGVPDTPTARGGGVGENRPTACLKNG